MKQSKKGLTIWYNLFHPKQKPKKKSHVHYKRNCTGKQQKNTFEFRRRQYAGGNMNCTPCVKTDEP